MPPIPRGWLLLVLVPAIAGADEAPVGEQAAGAPLRQPHAAYVEILGKHGLYGLGYDFATSERWAFGGAGAFLVVESERILSLGPYANLYPVVGRSSALVLQTGGQFVQVWVPSRVRGWSGTSATGFAGQLSAGYEYRNGFLLRILVSGVFGQGGIRPWLGIGLGRAF
jgi:hypothetical protein